MVRSSHPSGRDVCEMKRATLARAASPRKVATPASWL